MLVLNNNIRGKKFKVVKETQWNQKLLKGSKGVIIDIQRCFSLSTFIHGYRVNTLVCRVGKTGKFRLKRYILQVPLVKSIDDSTAYKLASFDSGIKIIDEDDLNKYSENDFIAWFAGKCTHFRGLINNAHGLSGANDRLITTYLANHPIWYALRNHMLVESSTMLVESNHTIAKEEHNFLKSLSDKAYRAEHVLFVKNLEALTALLQLYHDQAYFAMQLNVLNSTTESLTATLRNSGLSKTLLGKHTVPLNKKYTPYDILYNEFNALRKKDSTRLTAVNNLIRKKLNM